MRSVATETRKASDPADAGGEQGVSLSKLFCSAPCEPDALRGIRAQRVTESIVQASAANTNNVLSPHSLTFLKVLPRRRGYFAQMELWNTPAGFDEPLTALSACHRRIEKQLATLSRLQKHLTRHVCDDEAVTAAGGILRYFLEAAPNHHADEESDLFPRVLRAAQATADHARAFELVSRLLVEHRDMEALWERLREALASLTPGEIGKLDLDLCKDFAREYAGHIDREDNQLLPLATRVLKPDELEALGNAMAKRRGLPLPFPLA